MKRRVIILPRALETLDRNFSWWSEHRSEEQAIRWLADFTERLSGLSDNAEFQALAPEAESLSTALRQLNFGIGSKPTHRALFTIEDSNVLILNIRHLAQDDLAPEDLTGQ